MNPPPVHTSDQRKADRLWLLLGGEIIPVRRTGELFYVHTEFRKPLRANRRRHDVPAKLLTLINRLQKMQATNDKAWAS